MKNCTEFDRWLDAGMPASQAREAEAHARGCARCARMHEVELRLVTMLASPVSSAASAERAPEGFTDRVMARVSASSAARRSLAPVAGNDLPWWVAAAAEPATVLAALLGAVIVWQPKAMLSAALSVARVVMTGLGQSTGTTSPEQWFGPGIASLFTDPLTSLGVWLAVLPLALWLGYELYRWTERKTVTSIKLARSRQ